MRLFSFMLEFDRINIILGDTVSLVLSVSYMKLMWVFFIFLPPYFDLLSLSERKTVCVLYVSDLWTESNFWLPVHFHLCLQFTLHKRHVWSRYGFLLLLLQLQTLLFLLMFLILLTSASSMSNYISIHPGQTGSIPSQICPSWLIAFWSPFWFPSLIYWYFTHQMQCVDEWLYSGP